MQSITEQLADAPRVVSKRETVEEAAARLGIDAVEAKTLFVALGAKPDEVRSVDQTPDGLVVTMKSGSRMIWVPASSPDGAGCSGWMLYGRPDGKSVEQARSEKLPPYGVPIFTRRPSETEAKRPRKTRARSGARPDDSDPGEQIDGNTVDGDDLAPIEP